MAFYLRSISPKDAHADASYAPYIIRKKLIIDGDLLNSMIADPPYLCAHVRFPGSSDIFFAAAEIVWEDY